jgi:hypothetical protein
VNSLVLVPSAHFNFVYLLNKKQMEWGEGGLHKKEGEIAED